jgi:hypothetical protein
MSYRFRRSIKIAPGIRMNIGKKGASISLGGAGKSVSFGRRGVYSNIGLPGSGLSYRSKLGGQVTGIQGNSGLRDSRSQEGNTVRVAISVELEDDGSVVYKRENGEILSEEQVKQVKHQGKESIINALESKCLEMNQANESMIKIYRSTPPPDTTITFTKEEFAEPQPIQPSANFLESEPSISKVIFSGYSQRPNKKTGDIMNEYLYSIRVTRDKWEKINFNNLDAIDVPMCFEEFELRRNASKTGSMTPIEPFQL